MKSSTTYNHLTVEPITPILGAEVGPVDLADLNEATLAEIRQAFARHHVLVFRDQHLTREQHKAFGRLFGELHLHPAKTHLGLPGDPEIFDIRITAQTRVANGEAWHTDLSCEPIPPTASALYITTVPDGGGGDTLFASMHEAYAALSAPLQRLLQTLTAYHSGFKDLRAYGHEPQPGQQYPCASHPVVVRHRDSGAPLLFVNEAFTEKINALSSRESSALLDLLFRHIETHTRGQCRVRWQRNTLVLWDNQAVHHHAVWDYYPQTRLGERVTVKGVGAPQPWSAPDSTDT